MDLFWQITVVEFLLNVAVFAGAIIGYGPVRLIAARLPGSREFVEGTSVGSLFGVATAAAVVLPVHLEGGAAVGCQMVLVALAGPLAGSFAVLWAAAIPVVAELLERLAGGGLGDMTILSILASAAAGWGGHFVLARRTDAGRRDFRYHHLPLLGGLSAVGGLCALWLTQGTAATSAAVVPAFASSGFAAVILGTLLLHERRRHQAEREVRDSWVLLAVQARELAASRDTAEAANHAKSAFLANMSHELRTPLNAILGYAQLLLRDRGLSERQMNGARIIRQSGEHLLMLITDILDLSKIEAGKLELYPSIVDLPGFLTGVANIIRIRADEKALTLVCDTAPDLPHFVQIDDKRLRQVLLNLLGNAVKFTDRGQVGLHVDVLSRTGPNVLLRFEVRDSGVGVAPDQLETIFKPFEQVGAVERRSGGTGLGLSITRQLIQLMGSTIQVESRLGEGSRFWFELAMPVAGTQLVAPPTAQVAGYQGARRRVLIVDDTAANRAILADTLGNLGFEIHEAADGLEGVRQAEAATPDLILMDVRMPVMDGSEAIRRMRTNPDLQQTPIIAVSASAMSEDHARSLTAGANAFLTKPVEQDELLREIGMRLELAWIYEPIRSIAPSTDGDGQLVTPPPAEIEALYELAMAGSMRDIRKHADHLTELDARYRPFADKLRQMAQTYQSKAILELAKRHLNQKTGVGL